MHGFKTIVYTKAYHSKSNEADQRHISPQSNQTADKSVAEGRELMNKFKGILSLRDTKQMAADLLHAIVQFSIQQYNNLL